MVKRRTRREKDILASGPKQYDCKTCGRKFMFVPTTWKLYPSVDCPDCELEKSMELRKRVQMKGGE